MANNSNTTTGQGYFGYSYFLSNKSHPFPGGLPISWACPGAGKPSSENHANGNSLGGPIAVWCALDIPDEYFYDSGLANNTIDRLHYAAKLFNDTGKPFFVMSGFARPHTPWRVPQRFWDMYRTEEISLPARVLPPQDMPGVAWMAHSFWNATTGEVWPLNVTHPLPPAVSRAARHAYYASVSWLDYQIGRILAELEVLGMRQNTVVVLHGDHGWQLGEHNSWHKYTNFELGTRVPLIVRAPGHPSSLGRVAGGLAELVDLYPTVAELAGVPVDGEAVDGVSLVPFFQDPVRTSFPTTRRQGTLNKTVAFSQYPHSDNGALTPATQCPFFREGRCYFTPTAHTTAHTRTTPGRRVPSSARWMGFSVRDQQWRYTAWVPFNGTRAQWAQGAMAEELYAHDYPLNTTSMDAIDDVANLAYRQQHQKTCARYFNLVKEFFEEISPPTAPTGPPTAGCQKWCTDGKRPPSAYCKFIHCAACPACHHDATITSSDVTPSPPTIGGSVAVVWLIPSGIEGRGNSWDAGGKGGNISFWTNESEWAVYQRVRDSDAALLKSALGPNATAIIAFHHYLADVGYYGHSPLFKLQQVVEDFSSRGIKPLLFFLDCEFYGPGDWHHTHDVIRNASARSYLLANINRTLSDPNMSLVRHVSTYWLGESSRCNGRSQLCSDAQITEYLADVQAVVNAHHAAHLVHLDGQMWDACWPKPCSGDTWGVSGYSPRSLRDARVQGVMAESWAQGSLREAVASLLAAKAVPSSELLLLNDVPNCGQGASKRSCVTGSVEGDMTQWFADLEANGLRNTFGAWDWADGGVRQPNNYGIVTNDGSALTQKGRIIQARVRTL